MLEDTNGDGKMDKATTFLDKIVNPRSLSIVEAGALAALGDTNGDLVADRRTPLIEFEEAAPCSIEHAGNDLHFAIDFWLYNSKSSRRHK